MWNWLRIGFMASEEMSFKMLMTDGRWMPAYTVSSRMSSRLMWAKNHISTWLNRQFWRQWLLQPIQSHIRISSVRSWFKTAYVKMDHKYPRTIQTLQVSVTVSVTSLNHKSQLKVFWKCSATNSDSNLMKNVKALKVPSLTLMTQVKHSALTLNAQFTSVCSKIF